MKAVDLERVRDHLGLSNVGLAGALGLDPRTVRGYLGGAVAIPRFVPLACWALVMQPRVACLVPGAVLGR